MARVKVTEPVTGVDLEVDASSPQAKLWGKTPTKTPTKAPAKKSDN